MANKGCKSTRKKGRGKLKKTETHNPYKIPISSIRTKTHNPHKIPIEKTKKESKKNINNLTIKYLKEGLPEDSRDIIPDMKGSSKPSIVKNVGKSFKTGIGVAKDIGSLGMKVGKTTLSEVKDIHSTGSKIGKRTIKRSMKLSSKKNKKGKNKRKKNSYRSFLSKRLKEVKKAHPSWPQSKVFKEAVKGWKSK
jgi:hypothetical protein